MTFSPKEYGRCSKEQAVKALGAMPSKATKSVPGLALTTIVERLEANGSAPLEPILAELFPDDPVEKARRRLTTEIANRVYKDDAGDAPLRIATTRKGIEPALIWLETPIATDTRGLTDVGERYAPEHFIPSEAIQRTSEEIKHEIANPPKSTAQAATGSNPEQLAETANEDEQATVPLRESPNKSEAHRIAELKALENATKPNAGANDSLRGVDTTHFMSTDARQTSGFSAFADAVHQVGHTVNALDAMLAWASDGEKNAPKLLALLGDYGTGKTSHALQFSRILNGEVVHEKRPSPLLSALHIDLAYLRGAPGLAQLNVTQLIDLVIKARGLGEVLSANEVVHEVRSGVRIVVYDGLDELMQTDHAQLHSVFRQLLQIFEPDPVSREPSRARAIVSCRTHYFRDLAEQHEFFNSRMRGSVSGKDYLCLYLLPWDMSTVRGYLGKRLSEAEANALAETIRTTYNLEELASRPVLLAMMCEQVGEVLRMREQNGGSITASTLYAQTVAMWVRRDDEKHILQPTHKPILMGALACAMWNSGKEQWDAERLDAWLRTTVDLLFPNCYAPDKTRAIQDDLRTATFIVRPNGGGFTFAHRSFKEYFLARHLVWLLDTRSELGTNSLPVFLLTRPTVLFVSELLRQNDDVRAARARVLWECMSEKNPNVVSPRFTSAPRANEVLFNLALSLDIGCNDQHLVANLRDIDFSKHDWSGCVLPVLDLRGANLRGLTARKCVIGGLVLSHSLASYATFVNCEIGQVHWGAHRRSTLVFRISSANCQRHGPWPGPFTSPESIGATPFWVEACKIGFARGSSCSSHLFMTDATGRTLKIWDRSSGRVVDEYDRIEQILSSEPDGGVLVRIPRTVIDRLTDLGALKGADIVRRTRDRARPSLTSDWCICLRQERRLSISADRLSVSIVEAFSGKIRYFVNGTRPSTACFDAQGRLVDYDEEAADTWLRYLGNGYPQPVEAAWLELDEFGRALGPKKGVST